MELSSYFDAMSKAKKEYSRCLEPVCRDFGLTQNELAVLLFLRNNPNLDRAADIVSCRGIPSPMYRWRFPNWKPGEFLPAGMIPQTTAPAIWR